MADYFALLDEPRRPLIDPDELKEKFLARSASVHPDRVHHLGDKERAAAHEQYVQLNAAYQCLREPKDRIRHLLQLELGMAPRDLQQIPPALMDLFSAVGEGCREADRLVAENARVTSPILQVQCFERNQAQTERLQELSKRIESHREQLNAALRRIDAEWIAAPAGTSERAELLAALEELYRLFSFFGRWTSQIQDRIARLSV
jgi:DnaJ-domain-containing protein 1